MKKAEEQLAALHQVVTHDMYDVHVESTVQLPKQSQLRSEFMHALQNCTAKKSSLQKYLHFNVPGKTIYSQAKYATSFSVD